MYIYIYIYIYIHTYITKALRPSSVAESTGRRTAPSRATVLHDHTIIKNTCIIARNHFSQFASHEYTLSSCALELSWAIMGHQGLFLTTDYNG